MTKATMLCVGTILDMVEEKKVIEFNVEVRKNEDASILYIYEIPYESKRTCRSYHFYSKYIISCGLCPSL